MGLVAGNGSNLYDEFTGLLAGFVDRNGREQLLTDIGVSNAKLITPLVGGGVDNAPAMNAFLGPGGKIISEINGVQSDIETAGFFTLKSLVDCDPQISLNWESRGGIVFIPDARLPGITPGPAGTGQRLGGGAPAAMFRLVRRAPGLNRQAFEPNISFNIDGSGIKNWDVITAVDTSGNSFTSAGHGRQNGDTLYIASSNAMPAPLDEDTVYYVVGATTDTFQLAATLGGAAIDITTAGTQSGIGQLVWSTRVSGFRVPQSQPGSNPNDCDKDFDTRKVYTAGNFQHMDVVGTSGSGYNGEAGSGRLHLLSARSLNNFEHGWDIGGNDVVFTGHWAAGGNGNPATGGWGVKAGSASGLYAWGGNVWSAGGLRGIDCGAMWINGRAGFVVGGTQFNDWLRLDGQSNFNRSGIIGLNFFHPHAVNFSADGVCNDRTASGDPRVQSQIGSREYQGLGFYGNVFSRSEKIGDNGDITAVDTSGNTLTSNNHGLNNGAIVYTIGASLPAPLVQGTPYYIVNKTSNTFQLSLTLGGAAIDITSAGSGSIQWTTFPVWGNFGGDLTGKNGAAPAWIHALDGTGSTVVSATIMEGYTSSPDSKPWTGKPGTVTVTIASPGVFTWVNHPLVVGDRVMVHTTGALPTGLTPDTVNYYVVSVPTADTFQVSATYGGAAINTTGTQSGVHTCYHLSCAPFFVTGNAQLGFVIPDPYRGLINIGHRNGVAPKFMIFTSPNDSWEGNPNYFGEIGDRRLSGGLLKRYRAYGAWEFDTAPQCVQVNRGTVNNGDTKNVDAYAGQWYADVQGSSIASATFVMPQGMRTSYKGVIIINKPIGAITWMATLDSNSPVFPKATTSWTAIFYDYTADNDKYNITDVYGNDGYLSIGTTGLVSSDCRAAKRFFVGPLAGNVTISNPSSGQDGITYTWLVKENGTGGFTVTLGAKFRKAAGDGTFTTTANAVNIMQAVYNAADDKFDIVSFKAGIT